jgi:hypothetical protein
MAKYTCHYVGNGTEYTCLMNASSSAEAARRMSRLQWALGCGPVGVPHRNWRYLPYAKEVVPLAFFGTSARVLGGNLDHIGPEAQQIAALAESSSSIRKATKMSRHPVSLEVPSRCEAGRDLIKPGKYEGDEIDHASPDRDGRLPPPSFILELPIGRRIDVTEQVAAGRIIVDG